MNDTHDMIRHGHGTHLSDLLEIVTSGADLAIHFILQPVNFHSLCFAVFLRR